MLLIVTMQTTTAEAHRAIPYATRTTGGIRPFTENIVLMRPEPQCL